MYNRLGDIRCAGRSYPGSTPPIQPCTRKRRSSSSRFPATAPTAVAIGRDLAQAIGAVPLVLDDARRHDFLVATLSHLPYLLACALVQTADATTSEDPAAWEIVASGFRDTSRVAASDIDMMTDILLTNREEILNALREYGSHLHDLERLVKERDEKKLKQALSYVREKRKEMFA